MGDGAGGANAATGESVAAGAGGAVAGGTFNMDEGGEQEENVVQVRLAARAQLYCAWTLARVQPVQTSCVSMCAAHFKLHILDLTLHAGKALNPNICVPFLLCRQVAQQ